MFCKRYKHRIHKLEEVIRRRNSEMAANHKYTQNLRDRLNIEVQFADEVLRRYLELKVGDRKLVELNKDLYEQVRNQMTSMGFKDFCGHIYGEYFWLEQNIEETPRLKYALEKKGYYQ